MHSISVILSKKKLAVNLTEKYISAKSIPLAQDMYLVPLTEELVLEISDGVSEDEMQYKEFEFLSPQIVCELKALSEGGLISYVETEYYGGDGIQSSIVWNKGSIVFGPVKSTNYQINPINDSLKLFGIQIKEKHDEFDEIGLGRFRSTEKWYKLG